MIPVSVFTFSPFEENTYVISTQNKNCIIFDPGCYFATEEQQLKAYIEDKKLNPVLLINTHAHLDHIFGNAFVHKTWGLLPRIHRDELPMLQNAPQISQAYGLQFTEASPEPDVFLEEGDRIELDGTGMIAILTPGHSIASLSFYNALEGYLIAGDVLFRESIGRTDLPGGDYDTLINGIREKLFVLPDDTIVYPGHGPKTTIGYEKRNNPFLRD